MMTFKHIALTACLLLFVAACGHEEHHHDDHDHDHNNKDNTTPTEHEKMACTAFAGATSSALTASEEMATAKDVKLENAKLYDITLPASGTGYVSLHGLEEHSDVSFFVAKAETLNAMTFNGSSAQLPTAAANLACEEAINGFYSMHIHEAGMAVFELKGEANDTIKLMVMGAASDHSGHMDHKN